MSHRSEADLSLVVSRVSPAGVAESRGTLVSILDTRLASRQDEVRYERSRFGLDEPGNSARVVVVDPEQSTTIGLPNGSAPRRG